MSQPFGPWAVMRAGRGRNWGGEVRRARIFERLAERTAATVANDWPSLQRAVAGRRWRRVLVRQRTRPRLAASEGPPPSWAKVLPDLCRPIAVSIYDDAVAQARALGIQLTPEREADLRDRRRMTESLFRWIVVPTEAFAEAHGLPLDRIIVGGQGTVASRVRPGPWPERPAVGMVSGAAPGRGIEALVEAVRQVRAVVPETRLFLWLVATSSADDGYLAGLRADTADDPWITIEAAPYDRLGEVLSQATVLVVPHPAIEYMDVILPVKLFDCMAAGRPLVVTPRTETVKIVGAGGAGLVSTDDSPDALAEPIARLLTDDALARRMGAAGRRLAEERFDWGVLGDAIADEILRREGLLD
jgi:glycosyltransferase involved in cell wall biosynthesis